MPRILIPFCMDLTDGLLMEILLRLPAKSLIRFKSVCKKWQNLISSDYFCHHHTLRRPRPQPSLILQTGGRVPLFFFDGEKTIIPYNFDMPDIVQACNGLLLLKTTRYMEEKAFDDPTIDRSDMISLYDAQYDRKTRQYEPFTCTFSVYNPTTRQSRKISLTDHKHDYPRLAAVFLAFDPSISPFYKIACIRATGSRDPDSDCFTFHVEVYDSERRGWKVSLEAVTLPPAVTFFTSGVHWNNSIYWSSEGEYFCFDIAKNEMKKLDFPQNPDIGRGVEGYHCFRHLQESNGHLYHFESIWEPLNNDKSLYASSDLVAESVAVWEFEGNNEWLLKYRHTLGDGKRGVTRNLIGLLVGSDGDGDETCCLLMYTRSGRMKAYNFLDKTYEDLFYFERDVYSVLGLQFGEVLALV